MNIVDLKRRACGLTARRLGGGDIVIVNDDAIQRWAGGAGLPGQRFEEAGQ